MRSTNTHKRLRRRLSKNFTIIRKQPTEVFWPSIKAKFQKMSKQAFSIHRVATGRTLPTTSQRNFQGCSLILGLSAEKPQERMISILRHGSLASHLSQEGTPTRGDMRLLKRRRKNPSPKRLQHTGMLGQNDLAGRRSTQRVYTECGVYSQIRV